MPSATAAAAAPVLPIDVAADRRRYPGVRSFEERDQARFFGRGRATEELLLRVLSVRLLLQFAPSGVGKTSLLNAGLFPRLREHHLFPVTVRLNEPSESLTQAVRRSLRESAQTAGLIDPVIPDGVDRLWDLLAGVQLWSPDLLLLMPVLVFDQFEEAFTLRDDRFREEFGREIGALSLGRALETAADGGGPPAPAPDVKVILSLREEYLGKLEEFSTRVPDLFHERLRLRPLTEDEAREAIVEPARLPGDQWLSPAFEFEAACLGQLLDYVDGSDASLRVIEPLTLQLVCQRAEVLACERAAAGVPHPTLTIEDFGRLPGLEGLVDRFYRGELQKLPAGATRTHAQQMIEHGLLDPTGKRLMLEEDQIKRLYGLDRHVLDGLADSRLLRREPRNGSVFYEISHDRLTEVITKKRGRAPLPWWVALVLASAVIMIVSLIVVVAMALSSKHGIQAANQRVENALSVLLNEELVERLREVGLTDALEHVLADAKIEKIDETPSKARVLSARHQGDIALERSTIAAARAHFLKALETIDGLPGSRGDGELLLERARTLERLGSVAEDAGQVSESARYRQDSIEIWERLLQHDLPSNQMMEAADVFIGLGRIQWRMGDAARAQATDTTALQVALRVLTTSIEDARDAHGDYVFDQGHAMQVYADAAANLAAEDDETRAAYLLARESVRLRPLSWSARRQVASASGMYASYVLYHDASRAAESGSSPLHRDQPGAGPAEAEQLLRAAATGVDELIRWDPENQRLRRDSAAAHLLHPEAGARCAETPACQLPSGRLREHLGEALGSVGLFRELAAADPDNRALTRDVAVALSVQGRLLYALGRHDEGLRCLDEAVALYRKAATDPRDLQWRLDAPRILRQKAALLAPSDAVQALATLDASLGELDKLPGDAVAVIQDRQEATTAKARLLRAAGRTGDADRLAADLRALSARLAYATRTKHQEAEGHITAGIRLRDAAIPLPPREALAQLGRALMEFQAANAAYPFEFDYWNSQLATYKAMRQKQDELGSTPDAEVLGTLRGALMAAWMARVLNSDPQWSQRGTADSWMSAYQARRELIQFLRRHNRTGEADAQVMQAVAEVAEYAHLLPDAATALRLRADVNGWLGQSRFASQRPGWEEGLRSAIEYREEIAVTEPGNADNRTRLGRTRRALAEHLKAVGRAADAAREFTLALAACRAAEGTVSNDTERANLKQCFTDLATAGYK